MTYLIGIDIGGSHMTVGLVDLDGNLLDSQTFPINNKNVTQNDILSTIERFILDMLKNKKSNIKSVKCIGIGSPGQIKDGVLVFAANLPTLANFPICKLLSQRFNGTHVYLINDADAAVSAEVLKNKNIYGTYKNIAMVTVGTGIGLGLFLNGQLYRGSHELIEGGHMIIPGTSTSRLCGCGQKDCVEMYSSVTSLIQRIKELDLIEGNITKSINGKEIFDRYTSNDFNAVRVVEEASEHLALLSINLSRVIDPDIIVFGGGLAKAGNLLLEPVQKSIEKLSWKVLPTYFKISTALQDENGLIGAALAAKSLYESHNINALKLSEPKNSDIFSNLSFPGVIMLLSFGSLVVNRSLAKNSHYLSLFPLLSFSIAGYYTYKKCFDR